MKSYVIVHCYLIEMSSTIKKRTRSNVGRREFEEYSTPEPEVAENEDGQEELTCVSINSYFVIIIIISISDLKSSSLCASYNVDDKELVYSNLIKEMPRSENGKRQNHRRPKVV